MHKTRSLVSLLAFTAFAFAAAGCGGGGGGGGTAPLPGGGGGGTPPPSTPPPNTPPPITTLNATSTIDVVPGHGRTNTTGVVGSENGTSSNAAAGGVNCNLASDAAADPKLHHHAFVGIWSGGASGKEATLPRALGMYQPAPPDSTGRVNSATCFYTLHTHDESGVVHIEPLTGDTTTYTFGNFMAVAGLSGLNISSTQVGPLSGSVSAWVGTTTGQVGSGASAHFPVTKYNFVSDMSSIQLTSHTAIWLVVGDLPSGLPEVDFYIE